MGRTMTGRGETEGKEREEDLFKTHQNVWNSQTIRKITKHPIHVLGNILKQIVRNSNVDNPLPQDYYFSINNLFLKMHMRINLVKEEGMYS